MNKEICSQCDHWKGFAGCMLKNIHQERHVKVEVCSKFIIKDNIKKEIK